MLATSSGMQSLYVRDGLGNPTALITSTPYTAFAYEYDPYGTAALTEDSGGTTEPVHIQERHPGRATGWIKYGARWYNPAIGRWTQQATLNAPLDLSNANRYAYAANDPINMVDPTGLALAGSVGCGVAVGASLLAVGGVVPAPFTGGFGFAVANYAVSCVGLLWGCQDA